MLLSFCIKSLLLQVLERPFLFYWIIYWIIPILRLQWFINQSTSCLWSFSQTMLNIEASKWNWTESHRRIDFCCSKELQRNICTNCLTPWSPLLKEEANHSAIIYLWRWKFLFPCSVCRLNHLSRGLLLVICLPYNCCNLVVAKHIQNLCTQKQSAPSATSINWIKSTGCKQLKSEILTPSVARTINWSLDVRRR